MSKFKRMLLVLLATGLLTGTVAVGCWGCKSPPQRQIFTEAQVPAVTLDGAMTLWGDYVRQFHPSIDTERKVLALYRKVKAAELADIDLAHAAATAVTNAGTNGVTIQVAWSALTSPATQQALAELIGLLRQLGVKL